MTPRDRFLAALNGTPHDRPPVWMMRQAGRYLPEYLELKAKHSFVELAQTPELAAEVTLQPLRRFEFDAAIIFSDILVIPEALGQPYSFRSQGGIQMEYALQGPADITRLDPSGIREKLAYVRQALERVHSELRGKRALLGFGGSPWTLATYMIEGGTSKEFEATKTFAYTHPDAFKRLMQMLCDTLIEYFHMQIEAGVDAIQIFDSWGSACPGQDYWELSLQWIQRIIQALPKDFPLILFAKGMSLHGQALLQTGARVLSIDPSVRIDTFRRTLPGDYALQGNLDPAILSTTPDITRKQTQRILDSMANDSRFIFNLGHGILPSAKIDNVHAMLETLQSYSTAPAL